MSVFLTSLRTKFTFRTAAFLIYQSVVSLEFSLAIQNAQCCDMKTATDSGWSLTSDPQKSSSDCRQKTQQLPPRGHGTTQPQQPEQRRVPEY